MSLSVITSLYSPEKRTWFAAFGDESKSDDSLEELMLGLKVASPCTTPFLLLQTSTFTNSTLRLNESFLAISDDGELILSSAEGPPEATG